MEIMNDFRQAFVKSIILSNGVVVSDPAYCISEVNTLSFDKGDYLGGKYHCILVQDVSKLLVQEVLVIRSGYRLTNVAYSKYLGNVGVDSGCICICDKNEFTMSHDNVGCDDEWYDRSVLPLFNNEVTHHCGNSNVIVVRSGHGDGLYKVFGLYNHHDKMVGLWISFLTDDNNESDCETIYSLERGNGSSTLEFASEIESDIDNIVEKIHDYIENEGDGKIYLDECYFMDDSAKAYTLFNDNGEVYVSIIEGKDISDGIYPFMDSDEFYIKEMTLSLRECSFHDVYNMMLHIKK